MQHINCINNVGKYLPLTKESVPIKAVAEVRRQDFRSRRYAGIALEPCRWKEEVVYPKLLGLNPDWPVLSKAPMIPFLTRAPHRARRTGSWTSPRQGTNGRHDTEQTGVDAEPARLSGCWENRRRVLAPSHVWWRRYLGKLSLWRLLPILLCIHA